MKPQETRPNPVDNTKETRPFMTEGSTTIAEGGRGETHIWGMPVTPIGMFNIFYY